MRSKKTSSQDKRAIRSSKFNFLMRELEFWKEASLITQEQLIDIKAHYDVSGSYFSMALVNLGAVLLGAALLSYIAANWMEFSRVTKISLILLAYVCSVFSAWLVDKKSPILSRSLLLLSSFAYGGGIFLIAQIFHEGGHYTTALLLWIAGITPACALFKDRQQLSLIQIISIVYLFGIFMDVHYSFRSLDRSLFIVLDYFKWQVALVAGLWALWFHTKGRINYNLNVLITICLIFLILHIWAIRESEIILYLFCLGAILGFIPRGWNEDINVWGVALVGICGLIMTNPSFWRYRYDDFLYYVFMSFPSLIGVLSYDFLAVSSGILTCTLMTLFMFKGSNLAVFFFCAVILRYFFDKIYDFIPKSITFAAGGIILVAVGLLIGKIHMNKKNKNAENAIEEAKS